jgi:predicted GNAT superfamily acetyltransferase
MADAAPGADVRARPLESTDELERAALLYREVFGYTDPSHGVNPRLLAALAANGGSVVGALTPDGTLVGFAYGFAAVDDAGRSYHYSQAAVVSAVAQGLGVGRRLKHAQADVARSRGAATMRWCFDPVLARNAHFNLDVLGARGRWFQPDFYGPGTDRLVVEWDLHGEPGAAAVPTAAEPRPRFAQWGVPVPIGESGAVTLPVPASFGAHAADDPVAAERLRAALHVTIPALLAGGLSAVSCRRLDDRTAAYLFAPS